MRTSYFRPVVSFFSFLFFSSPNLSGRRVDVYHTSTHVVAFKCEFRMQDWICCTRLAGNTGRKNDAEIAICATSHNFVGLNLRNWCTYRQSEKHLLNSSTFSTCLFTANFSPLAAELGSLVRGIPANLQLLYPGYHFSFQSFRMRHRFTPLTQILTLM